MIIGTVTDALRGDAVYKAKIIVGERSTIRYVDKNFQITNLDPATYKLRVSAPGYESVTKNIIVGKGPTPVNISLRGTQIPDLEQIIAFSEPVKGKGIQLEIRLVNKNGLVISHFPKTPMSLNVRLYTRRETDGSYSRGKLIYSGPVNLYYDSEAPLGKIKGMIPKEQISRGTSERYGILDAILNTPQGNFKYTRTDVLLES